MVISWKRFRTLSKLWENAKRYSWNLFKIKTKWVISYNLKNLANFSIKSSRIFIKDFFCKYLKIKIEDTVHTIAQANISKGQWIPHITLDKFMIITKGKKKNHIFLKPVKKRETKKAKLTLAWSEGKDASGKCDNISFQVVCR